MQIIDKCFSKKVNYIDDDIKKYFPMAYDDYQYMKKVVYYEKNNDKSACFTLPLSEIIISEGMGVDLIVNKKDNTLKSNEYVYDDIEILASNINFNIETKKIKNTMQLCKYFSEKNEEYIFNIPGVMSILNSMIDITKVFKAIRKNKELIEIIFSKFRKYIIEYSQMAFDNGVRVISYSDPILREGIMSKKESNWVMENFTYKLLSDLKKIMPNDAIIHICPQNLKLMELAKLISTKDFTLEENYYNKLVFNLREKEQFVGGMCINSRINTKEIKKIELVKREIGLCLEKKKL